MKFKKTDIMSIHNVGNRRNMNDLHDAMKPIYYFLKIFGLVLYEPKLKNNQRIYETHTSLSTDIFKMFIISVIIITGSVYKLHREVTQFRTIVALTYLYKHISKIIQTIIMYIYCVAYRNCIVEYYNQLFEFDRKLESFNITINYKNSRKLVILEIIVMFLMIILKEISTGTIFVYSYITRGLAVIAYYLPFFINWLVLCEFSNAIWFVWHRFLIINNMLQKIVSEILLEENNKQQIVIIKNIENIYERNANMLREIAKLHYQLCETTKLINRSYNYQLLATIALGFGMCMDELYNLYKATDWIVKSNHMGWILIHALKYAFIGMAGHMAEQQGSYTGAINHKIKHTQSNKNINIEVQLFSLQLIHQKVELTASGMFPINFSLLYNIIAASATYVILIIQFDAM